MFPSVALTLLSMVGLLTAVGAPNVRLLVTPVTAVCRTPFEWAPGRWLMIMVAPKVVIGLTRLCITCMILPRIRLVARAMFPPR